jgi:membrane protein
MNFFTRITAWKNRLQSIPRPRWWAFAVDLYKNINNDNVTLISAGIAFYFLMAIFPAIAAGISIYGLFSDPYEVMEKAKAVEQFLPKDAMGILMDQAGKIASADTGVLSFSLLTSLLLTLYTTMQGAKALITGCNIAYNCAERRNVFKLNLTAYALTLFLVVYFILSLGLVAIIPAVVGVLNIFYPLDILLLWCRWPAMFVLALSGLSVVYRFAPSRLDPRWEWLNPGAVTATSLWLFLSSLFSAYVSNFGKYNETYGSLGAVVILLLWFLLTALTILLGAEVNATLEQRKNTGKPAETL